MGCILCKPGHDDPVRRCKARKSFMKQALKLRLAFSRAHSAYLASLRNTGEALRHFSEGEGALPASGPGPYAMEPRPPPPLPPCLLPPVDDDPSLKPWDFSQEYAAAAAAARSPSKGPGHGDSSGDKAQEARIHAVEEAKEEEEDGVPSIEMKEEVGLELELGLSLKHAAEKRKSLADIMKELYQEFIRASAADTLEASRILEARTPDDLVSDDPPGGAKYRRYRSARVFHALSWNWPKSSISSSKGVERKVDPSGRTTSHSLTLERLLACEKKLLEQVKLVESLRVEREKKCAILRHQETKGEDDAEIEKTRAEIKKLHSLIVISSQGVDATAEAIEDLRDDDLHPQLVALIDALMTMWVTMHRCHAKQTEIIIHLKSLDALTSNEPTCKAHHEATLQLQRELSEWHGNFQRLVTSQRAYMAALHGWLKLSLVPVLVSREKRKAMEDYDDEERVGFELLRLSEEWHRALNCLPDKVAGEAIKSLAEVVKGMAGKQAEEMKQRKRVERLEKQWEKKARVLKPLEEEEEEEENASNRSSRRRRNGMDGGESIISSDGDEDAASSELEKRSRASLMMRAMPMGLMERKAAVAGLKKKLESEMAKHCKAVQDTRVLTMNNLQTALPGVLEAMTGFSSVCAQSFQQLHSLSRFSSNNSAID